MQSDLFFSSSNSSNCSSAAAFGDTRTSAGLDYRSSPPHSKQEEKRRCIGAGGKCIGRVRPGYLLFEDACNVNYAVKAPRPR